VATAIEERIQDDMKAAMRAGETLRRDTLRMVVAALKNRRIELGRDLDDQAVLGVLTSAVKTRQDSAEQYDSAGRPELAEKERAEIAVVQAYLPSQLSEDETRAVVEAAIAELGATTEQDLGKVMKAVMARHKGAVDGKTVQRLAAERLG
jgi:uncharacterized protein YqeY